MYSPLNTEQQQLTALAKGERETTEQIYRQHYPIISGWLAKQGASDDDSADLFQESIVVLFGKAQNADFRLTCSLGTYLFSISKHLWYKKLQQLQKGPTRLYDEQIDDEDGGGAAYEDDVNTHHEREVHYEQLSSSMDKLGEPCRSLLKAFYHDDKSMQEISADFGYTNPENAKTQKYKCLTRLKKLFFATQAK